MAMMFQTLQRVMGPSDALQAACRCGHRKTWPWREAFAVFGPDATPVDVRRRVRCAPCKTAGRPRSDPVIDIERGWTGSRR